MRTPIRWPRIATLLALPALVSGCGSVVAQTYHAAPPGAEFRAYSGATQVYASTDPGDDGARLAANGYVRIGVSSFATSGHVTFDELLDQARAVGADVVLFSMTKPGSGRALPPVALSGDGRPRPFASYVHVGGSLTAFSGSYGDSGMVGGGSMDFKGSVTSSGIPSVSSEEMAFINAPSYQYSASFWRRRSAGP